MARAPEAVAVRPRPAPSPPHGSVELPRAARRAARQRRSRARALPRRGPCLSILRRLCRLDRGGLGGRERVGAL
eukprot:scaffold79442_cov66-Phaeocystis_antarctica.AAC.2